MGYQKKSVEQQSAKLPLLLPSVFYIADACPQIGDDTTLERLRFLYAKNYTVLEDVNLIWKCLWRK
jgi:hypothetical protein